jgi:glucosylceramidase
MKSTGSLVGGALSGQFYDSYPRYLVRSVRAYTDAGIRVGGLTLQNEPSFSPSGYPGMILTAAQQKELIVGQLRPALVAAGLNNVGIWALDDNYDRVADAQLIVSGGAARSAIAGVAFHCYHGDVSALKDFHAQHPDVALAISECTGGDWSANFSDNLRYDVHTLLINGIRDGASWVSKWNVALDESGGPSNGGCTNCRGLITVNPDNGSVSYNEAFYAFGHLARFVTPGAHVIASTSFGDVSVDTVAFRNPDGSHVLLATNGAADPKTFRVQSSGRQFQYTLAPGAVATFTW